MYCVVFSQLEDTLYEFVNKLLVLKTDICYDVSFQHYNNFRELYDK